MNQGPEAVVALILKVDPSLVFLLFTFSSPIGEIDRGLKARRKHSIKLRRENYSFFLVKRSWAPAQIPLY